MTLIDWGGHACVRGPLHPWLSRGIDMTLIDWGGHACVRGPLHPWLSRWYKPLIVLGSHIFDWLS